MGKNVRRNPGALRGSALVLAGWIAFGIACFLGDPFTKAALLAIARVLP